MTRVDDYNLVWPPGFELSDQTIAEIKLKEAQARKLQLSWMTVDEVQGRSRLRSTYLTILARF